MSNAVLAHIVHLTDFHLNVNRQGQRRDAAQTARTVQLIQGAARLALAPAWFQELARGLNAHSDSQLRALKNTLPPLVAQLRQEAPVLAVQTGDLEAYGVAPGPDPLPAHDHWNAWRTNIKGVAEFVDVYGNHDVWPGTLPILSSWFPQLLAHGMCAQAEETVRGHPLYRSPPMPGAPIVTSTTRAGLNLEVFLLNSVLCGYLQNTLALGNVHEDRIAGGSGCPFQRMAQASTSGSGTAIRIAVVHHPPHFFNATGGVADLTAGRLMNATSFAQGLADARVHLVLAGHRHALDPAPSVTIAPVPQARAQAPLPWHTVQLVANAPTQAGDLDLDPSFSVYSLTAEDASDDVSVVRTIYRQRTRLDSSFTPDIPTIVVPVLPLV